MAAHWLIVTLWTKKSIVTYSQFWVHFSIECLRIFGLMCFMCECVWLSVFYILKWSAIFGEKVMRQSMACSLNEHLTSKPQTMLAVSINERQVSEKASILLWRQLEWHSFWSDFNRLQIDCTALFDNFTHKRTHTHPFSFIESRKN